MLDFFKVSACGTHPPTLRRKSFTLPLLSTKLTQLEQMSVSDDLGNPISFWLSPGMDPGTIIPPALLNTLRFRVTLALHRGGNCLVLLGEIQISIKPAVASAGVSVVPNGKAVGERVSSARNT